jgi:DNA (cytosine-5)-methyltransferase 1
VINSPSDEPVEGHSAYHVVRSANLKTQRGERVRLPPKLGEGSSEAVWRAAMSDLDAMIAVDLFCGAGGLGYGLQQAGFTVAAGIDSDPDSCETHAANLLSRTLCLDVREIEDPSGLMDELRIPRVDVIVGGPPCQGFSLAGMAKIRSLTSEQREQIYARNYLYREFLRFVDILKPLFFIMENVPHLSCYADGLIVSEIERDFDALGYRVYNELLDAANYGVPQMRRRLFFIGTRIGWVYRRPRPTHGHVLPLRTLADAIGELPAVTAPSLIEQLPYVPRIRPEIGAPGEYADLMRSRMSADQENILFDHLVRPVRDDDSQIFRSMRPGDRYRDVDQRYRRYKLERSKRDGRYSFADRYQKLRWDRPCSTITAHICRDGYRYIYPDDDQPRTLSVREAARVQSFPDHFRFAGYRSSRFRQIGNAVPPLLAEAIGRSVARAIKSYRLGQLQEPEWQPPLRGFRSALTPAEVEQR